MNSGAMRIHSKGHFQGGIPVKNEKNRPSLKSLKTDNKPEKPKYKPLWGKVFYIDLPSVTISEKLQKDIKDLGGRVEEFLSKDISYLISNKKEAKFAQTLGRISPIPSPESANNAETTSPHPSHDGSSFKSPDTLLSRVRLFVTPGLYRAWRATYNTWGGKELDMTDKKNELHKRNHLGKKRQIYRRKTSTAAMENRIGWGGRQVGGGIRMGNTLISLQLIKINGKKKEET
ncbi:hypothetical protein FD754_021927 [Muntiacus muntjak]|uniref:Uncharacterized protein n=1 Tax=Muntiacus muntjak TaxID=9888 RepID=A0A5N3V9J8_MUNMU|nr:hypothetical protein FD754_021927 [Muntiacus muntjak]